MHVTVHCRALEPESIPHYELQESLLVPQRMMPQGVKRDFRRAIEPNRQQAGAGAYRRVTGHLSVTPCAGAHGSRQSRFQLDRKSAGQTELATMGVSAQHDIEACARALSVYLRGMRQQNRKSLPRNLHRRLADVIGAVEVRVIDAGKIDGLTAALDRYTLVEQHSYTHGFHPWSHANGVMIAEDGINRRRQPSNQFADVFKALVERSIGFAAIIAGEHAKVISEIVNNAEQMPHGAGTDIGVEIADVEDDETIEVFGQSG